MKRIVLLATLATVFIAGCVTPQIPFIAPQPTVVAGAGLTITDFSVDPSEVYSTSTARVLMTVDNLGGSVASDSNSMVMLIGSALKLDDTTGMYWSNPSETIFKHFGKDMKPADPVREIPADTKTFTWSLTAPNVSKGQMNDYIFIGRVYYDYQSSVSGTIWVYSQSEADAARAAGRTLNKATFSAISAPVSLTVKATPDPVVLAPGENKFTLIITVSNVGGGTLYKKGAVDYTTGSENVELTTDELNRVDISITAPGMTIPATCTGEQELIGGKDLKIVCDVTVDTPPTTFQGYPITIKADYGYFTERTASVSVSGR